jgi:hypothetical protein
MSAGRRSSWVADENDGISRIADRRQAPRRPQLRAGPIAAAAPNESIFGEKWNLVFRPKMRPMQES